MEVLACSNPLKQIRHVASYEASYDSSTSIFLENKNKWNVNIVPQYMDLTQGIWNVSLDSYIYKLKKPIRVDTIFEVSTSLCTSFESVQGKNLNKAVFTRLGSIHAISPANISNFGPFEKKWFLVEPAESEFELFITQNKMSQMQIPSLVVEFDISFLFQRIK